MSGRRTKVMVGSVVAAAVAAAGMFAVQLRSTIGIPSGDGHPGSPNVAAAHRQPVLEARRIIAPLLDQYPGISVAVGVADSIVWSEAFGYVDIQERAWTTPESRFRAYSVAKPLTATAVLRLHQDGRVDLDSPVGRYVHGLPPSLGGVTIRQLGGHLSGIRDYRKGEWLRLSSRPCSTPSEALDAFAQDPLMFPPDSTFAYSTFNYVVLSALVEAVSGVPFEAHMKEAVLDPSEMRDTSFGNAPESAPSVSMFYEPAMMGRVRVAREVDNSCKFGAGALVTTSRDLAAFGNALLAGRLLSPEWMDVSFASMKTSSGEETGYAFGWGVGVDSAGTTYAVHSGGAIGGRSALVVYPDAAVVVAILANIEEERLTDEAVRIGALFLPKR